jgi:amino-acid N-acetyltransferase
MEQGVRKAMTRDVPGIQELVNANAQAGLMLGLSRHEIYEQLRDFCVVERDGAVVGVCALHVAWDDLAEVRSLAVRDDVRHQGWGRRLVMSCIAEARDLGVRRVFALTYQGGFFSRLGFAPVDKGELPHKIWTDCLKCVKFPNCDEESWLLTLE